MRSEELALLLGRQPPIISFVLGVGVEGGFSRFNRFFGPLFGLPHQKKALSNQNKADPYCLGILS